MTSLSPQFQIEQLRAKNLHKSLEALISLVGALFVSALLPSLLVRYFYADQNLMEEPRLLQFIPLVAFIYAIGFCLQAAITNMMREMSIKRLEAEMMRGEIKSVAPRSSTTDLQVALSRVELAHTKTSKAKTIRAKKVSARRK